MGMQCAVGLFVSPPHHHAHSLRRLGTLLQTSVESSHSSTLATPVTFAHTTPPPIYPVARGSEVDARKIVATGKGRQHIQAVRMAHILFATEELAMTSLSQIRSAEISFELLAKQISACAITRDHGGLIGWVPLTGASSASEIKDEEDYFANIIPRNAREQVTQITTKPGDITLVESHRGFHLVQIQDIMVDVRKLATYRRSRSASSQHFMWQGLTAPLSPMKSDMTYRIETMGCQMNLNDSEVRSPAILHLSSFAVSFVTI
jgi:PPIC-type PPIASE domain